MSPTAGNALNHAAVKLQAAGALIISVALLVSSLRGGLDPMGLLVAAALIAPLLLGVALLRTSPRAGVILLGVIGLIVAVTVLIGLTNLPDWEVTPELALGAAFGVGSLLCVGAWIPAARAIGSS